MEPNFQEPRRDAEDLIYQALKEEKTLPKMNKNIEILRMTGEVTDSFNEINLFGMALFWQKAIEFFTKFIIHWAEYGLLGHKPMHS